MLGKWFRFGYEGGFNDPQALAKFCRGGDEVDSNASSEEGRKHDGRRHMAAPDFMYESRPSAYLQHQQELRRLQEENNRQEQDQVLLQVMRDDLMMFSSSSMRRRTFQNAEDGNDKDLYCYSSSSSSSSSSSASQDEDYGSNHGEVDHLRNEKSKKGNRKRFDQDANEKANRLRRQVLASLPFRRDRDGNNEVEHEDANATMQLEERARMIRRNKVKEVRPRHAAASFSKDLFASIPKSRCPHDQNLDNLNNFVRFGHSSVVISEDTALVFGGIVPVVTQQQETNNNINNNVLQQQQQQQRQIVQVVSSPEFISLKSKTIFHSVSQTNKKEGDKILIPCQREVLLSSQRPSTTKAFRQQQRRVSEEDTTPPARFGATFVSERFQPSCSLTTTTSSSSPFFFLFGGTNHIPVDVFGNININNNNSTNSFSSTGQGPSDDHCHRQHHNHLNDSLFLRFLSDQAQNVTHNFHHHISGKIPQFSNCLNDFWIGWLSETRQTDEKKISWKKVSLMDSSSYSSSTAGIFSRRQEGSNNNNNNNSMFSTSSTSSTSSCCFSQAVWLRKYEENQGALECHEILQFGGFSSSTANVSDDLSLFTITIPTTMRRTYNIGTENRGEKNDDDDSEIFIVGKSKSVLSSCFGTAPTARGGHSMVKIDNGDSKRSAFSEPSLKSIVFPREKQQQDESCTLAGNFQFLVIYGGYGIVSETFNRGKKSENTNAQNKKEEKKNDGKELGVADSYGGLDDDDGDDEAQEVVEPKKLETTKITPSTYAGLDDDDDDDDDYCSDDELLKCEENDNNVKHEQNRGEAERSLSGREHEHEKFYQLDYLNDCYLLDYPRKIWRKIEVPADHRSISIPRCFHSMTVLEKDEHCFEIFVLGGETVGHQPVASCFRINMEIQQHQHHHHASRMNINTGNNRKPKFLFHKQFMIGPHLDSSPSRDSNNNGTGFRSRSSNLDPTDDVVISERKVGESDRRQHQCSNTNKDKSSSSTSFIGKRHGSMLSAVVLRAAPPLIESAAELLLSAKNKSRKLLESAITEKNSNLNLVLGEEIQKTSRNESSIVILGGTRTVQVEVGKIYEREHETDSAMISRAVRGVRFDQRKKGRNTHVAMNEFAEHHDADDGEPSTSLTCLKYLSPNQNVVGEQNGNPLRLLAARWLAGSEMLRK